MAYPLLMVVEGLPAPANPTAVGIYARLLVIDLGQRLHDLVDIVVPVEVLLQGHIPPPLAVGIRVELPMGERGLSKDDPDILELVPLIEEVLRFRGELLEICIDVRFCPGPGLLFI